ncbi:MAG: auracyanin family protein [Bacteroidetes bacterium]|nr:MAG: auracyanin family protein [Bacteroidota bacterium]
MLLRAQDNPFYRLITLPIPEGIVLEGGGLTTLPSGDIALVTRHGDAWIVENPYMEGNQPPHYRRFASGLHEPLGLAWHDGTLWVTQRGELTRLWDKNGDGRADFYESVYRWPLTGNYHEYSYGPAVGPDGQLYVTANVGFFNPEWWRGQSEVPWRGWTLRISPSGEMEPYAAGMRSPNGYGFIDGEFFYADNQGDWMGSGGLVHLEKGDFAGHPASLRWAEHPQSPLQITQADIFAQVDPQLTPEGAPPFKPENDPDGAVLPLYELARELPGVKTPAVWLPHGVLGISTGQFLADTTEGAFGPFAGQVFVSDQGQSKISRIFLEKVDGVYQGASFGFFDGFASGAMRLSWGRDGSLFVAQTNRGWGSTGREPFALQRLVWTGKIPFEIQAVRAMPDGFELSFTRPVDKGTAADPASYALSSFIYKYHPVYGSPAVNLEEGQVRYAEVSRDGLKVRLVVDGLREGYIHELRAEGVRDYTDGQPPLHPTAYYTLNRRPQGDTLAIPAGARAAHHHHPAPAEAAPAPVPTPRPRPAGQLAKNQTTLPAHWTEGPDLTIRLSTKPGLQFDVQDMTVEAGTRIRLIFNNPDDMPHNFLLLRPGQADKVGKAALALGVKGMAMDYVPEMDEVLYHSKLLQPATNQTIYLEAPSEPGVYPYVCTYPGHYVSMRGVLRVK